MTDSFFKSMFRHALFIVTVAGLISGNGPLLAKDETFPVAIRIRADQPVGELKPIWRFFGADEPNYATLPDGRKLMAELGQLRTNEVFFARTIC
jgi:xylan 1,4-beta-xylosidase